MSAVDENTTDGHGLVGESVDEGGLDFTLDVMGKNQRDQELLVEEQGLLGCLPKEAEGQNNCGNYDRSGVFDKKDCAPADLAAHVLEIQHDYSIFA